jgi:hypothetical protein
VGFILASPQGKELVYISVLFPFRKFPLIYVEIGLPKNTKFGSAVPFFWSSKLYLENIAAKGIG